MNRFMKWVLSSLMCITLVTGCGAQYRNAALDSQNIAKKQYVDGAADLYQIAVKQALALAKSELALAKADGTLEAQVQVTHDGKTVTLSKYQAIVNRLAQTIIDASWCQKNVAEAGEFQDLAWIYISSRESFFEVFVKDVQKAVSAAKSSTTVVTTAPG